jgi:hypothetical protein
VQARGEFLARHVVERAAGAQQVVAQHTHGRICEQQAIEFGALRAGDHAVDFGVDQFERGVLASHADVHPLVSIADRSSWRALNRRDLTVFSGISRMAAMSSRALLKANTITARYSAAAS